MVFPVTAAQPIQRFGSLRALARGVARTGWPRVLIEFGGGIGDQLMCSALFRELRRRGEQRLWMMTNQPSLFAHNPDVDAVIPVEWRLSALLARSGARRIRPVYTQRNRITDRDEPPSPRHFIAQMCYLSGIHGEIAQRPYLHLTSDEQAAGRLAATMIVLQSSGMAARHPMRNKEWQPERFMAVAAALAGQATLVQLGAPTDPLLPGVLDLRGKTSLRESAAILYNAQMFIGLAGLLMHMARAVDCPSVIVYGGREDPAISGYPCNENLFTPVPCAPCWLWNRCDYDHRCMTAIAPDAVLAAAERLVARPRSALEVTTVMLP